MRTAAEQRAFSRTYSRPHDGLEWAAILYVLKAGLEQLEGTSDERVALVKALLPELEQDVTDMKKIDPSGCGLDHPDRSDW